MSSRAPEERAAALTQVHNTSTCLHHLPPLSACLHWPPPIHRLHPPPASCQCQPAPCPGAVPRLPPAACPARQTPDALGPQRAASPAASTGRCCCLAAPAGACRPRRLRQRAPAAGRAPGVPLPAERLQRAAHFIRLASVEGHSRWIPGSHGAACPPRATTAAAAPTGPLLWWVPQRGRPGPHPDWLSRGAWQVGGQRGLCTH